jgi:Uma2 family endonuclease
MSVGTAPMTVEDLLAMPDDGVQRWLIRGELREGGMTQRNRFHGRTEARFVQHLGNWLDSRPEPRGEIYSGEAGAVLHHDPDTSVGLDVMNVSPEVAAANPKHTQMVDGAPILAVEVFSPSSKQEETNEKIEELLGAGSNAVWIVDPYFKTVTVYSRDEAPRMYSGDDQIENQPYLPGFMMPVRKFFKR